MPSFEELQKKAEVQVAADNAAARGWLRAHRAYIIVIAISLTLGFILGHL